MFPVFWRRGAAIQAYFTVLCRYWTSFFYILKVYGDPALSKSIGTIFVTAFAHFMSVCHSLVILAIFQICVILHQDTFCLGFYFRMGVSVLIHGLDIC